MNPVQIFALAALIATPAIARADCYGPLGLDAFRPSPSRAVAVALDETTVLGERLGEETPRQVGSALRPGDRVSLIAFAGLGRDRHTREVLTLEIQAMPPAKTQDDMPMRRLKPLEACIKASLPKAVASLQAGITTVLKDAASQRYATSEIVLALREISAKLQHAKTPEKLLIAVTDGAEHSGLMSFYKNKDLRVIDPEAALARVAERSLFPDLSGVRVYLIGLGVAVGDQTRDQAVVLGLENFWRGYFTRAKARAVMIGAPALLVPIE